MEIYNVIKNNMTFNIEVLSKKFKVINILSFVLSMIVLPIVASNDNIVSTNQIISSQGSTLLKIWDETNQDEEYYRIQHGIAAYNQTDLIYCRNGHPVMEIDLKEPVVVIVATKDEPWGFYQFPNIYRNLLDNSLVCTWSMNHDSAESYGTGGVGRMFSSDNGKTWYSSNKSVLGGALVLPSGEMIGIHTPAAIRDTALDLPAPIATNIEAYGRKFSYYRHDEIPDVVKGVYINRWSNTGVRTLIHGTLYDPKLVRYTDSGLFPVVWWGDMELLPDNSIITGTYPAFYENSSGGVNPSGVSFYRTTNQGMHWDIVGKIPYTPDIKKDPNGTRRLALGYTEPAFEILQDGTFLCVLRTTDGYGDSPMYVCRSSDQGVTWTKPLVFTPSGVLPRLLQLENGVLVLASGRPGVQLRFSFDGKGEKWTDPFEMLPFQEGENSQSHTCGYPRLMATGPDRFMIVYSDFKYPTQTGELRKVIKVREVVVEKK